MNKKTLILPSSLSWHFFSKKKWIILSDWCFHWEGEIQFNPSQIRQQKKTKKKNFRERAKLINSFNHFHSSEWNHEQHPFNVKYIFYVLKAFNLRIKSNYLSCLILAICWAPLRDWLTSNVTRKHFDVINWNSAIIILTLSKGFLVWLWHLKHGKVSNIH